MDLLATTALTQIYPSIFYTNPMYRKYNYKQAGRFGKRHSYLLEEYSYETSFPFSKVARFGITGEDASKENV